ncbi:acyl-CoA N-acyltransferase [Podospora fimiseda]|uniref:Histone acetyltransferase type B catalytic subunit n=1 Tax=Podospora fimiseda TaxID=252190 RepID=A0AAN7H768_9PEZI|nr:acyl-CoA N-acyltransferase [Podospora fimiseda]
MPADEAWSANSNEALQLSLVAPSNDGIKTLAKFYPKFTYPIFGNAEEIFGYKNLQINLRYNATDMRPTLSITYSKKFTAVGETEATDIEGILREYLPEVAFQKKNDFEAAVKNVRDDWSPPGELLVSFNAHSKNTTSTYEVWKGNLADPAVKQVIKRIQILAPIYIEGGSAIPVDEGEDDRWTVFFLYQKKTSTADPTKTDYVFAGYSTVYRFFYFKAPISPPATPSVEDLDLENPKFDLSELPCRTRISQFIILPPFQGKGLGTKFYSLIFEEYINHPQTVEITVEDPNEAFDDMRDLADLAYLRKMPEFRALHLNTSIVIPKTGPAPNDIIDKDAYEACRRKAKIAPRQFARVLEMDLMSRLPDSVRPDIDAEGEEDEEEAEGGQAASTSNGVSDATKREPTPEEAHEYKLWKLLLKKRLFLHNKDALGQLEKKERPQKLNEAVANVEFDYSRLLLKLEELKKRAEAEAANGLSDKAKGKRKAVDEGDVEEMGSATKKARVEDAEE